MAVEFEKKSLARPEGEAIKRRAFSFFTAAFCLICCFATSATSIPMMAYWTEALGLTSAETAMTVVNYFGGCVLTLLLFARFSNLLGRKPVVIAALLCGIIACFHSPIRLRHQPRAFPSGAMLRARHQRLDGLGSGHGTTR